MKKSLVILEQSFIGAFDHFGKFKVFYLKST
jgi:hypothetical protein